MIVDTIKPEELRSRVQAGDTLTLIDVRTPAEYQSIHACGAESMPLDRLDPSAILSQCRDGKGPIYVICQTGGRSAQAVQNLKRAGVEAVCSIDGGTKAWAAAGLPVVRGSCRVISLERQVRIVAGSLVLIFSVMAWLIDVRFTALSALIGAGLVFAGVTDYCGMAMLLGKMPWNRKPPAPLLAESRRARA